MAAAMRTWQRGGGKPPEAEKPPGGRRTEGAEKALTSRRGAR